MSRLYLILSFKLPDSTFFDFGKARLILSHKCSSAILHRIFSYLKALLVCVFFILTSRVTCFSCVCNELLIDLSKANRTLKKTVKYKISETGLVDIEEPRANFFVAAVVLKTEKAERTHSKRKLRKGLLFSYSPWSVNTPEENCSLWSIY